MWDIHQRHQANPGKVMIEVASQGLTETGSVFHGRFRGFVEEPLERVE
jgi:hypothetical protein